MKLITFSLWGNDPKYCIGAIKNADLAKSIFPEWKCRFYVGESTDKKYVKKLKRLGSEVIEMEEEGDWCGMFWRFYAACEDDVEDAVLAAHLTRVALSDLDFWGQGLASSRGAFL